jgi:hypothetical protein
MSATLRATAREQVDLRQAAGPVAVAGLAVIATIHGLDVSGKLDETFYLGVMFILGPIMSALVSAGRSCHATFGSGGHWRASSAQERLPATA